MGCLIKKVEMAGIEPASERINRRTSTSVGFLYLASARWKHRPVRCQPFEPESPLSCRSRQPAWHSGFVAPAPPPVRGRGGQTPAHREPVMLAIRLCSEGQSSVSAVGTLVCADFTRSAPLGSPSGASLSRRSLSSPGYKYIIPERLPSCRVKIN